MLDGARRVVINGHCSLFDQGNGFWTISGPFLGNVSLRILNAAVLRVCPSYILYIIYTVYIYIYIYIAHQKAAMQGSTAGHRGRASVATQQRRGGRRRRCSDGERKRSTKDSPRRRTPGGVVPGCSNKVESARCSHKHTKAGI